MIESPEDLQEVIADLRHQGGDTTDFEVKRGRGGVPTLGRTLSAFGNMPDGGTIIVGLDEATGFAPTGIDDIAGMKQGIANQAREAVEPPVAVTFGDFLVAGQGVVVCTVAGLPLSARPCRYQGRAYLRYADGDYQMSEVEIQMVDDRKRQAVFESSMWVRDDAREVPESGIDDLDEAYVDSLLRNARDKSVFHRDKSDDIVLRNLGVTTRSGRLTVAGAYVLAAFPQKFVPSWSATAAVQLSGDDGRRTRDLEHFEGPLPSMFDGIRDWARRNMHTTIGYRSDGAAVDEAELPAVTVRELVANALVHRDLSPLAQGKRVEIRLTGDRMTVMNPGGLRGVTTTQLGHLGGKHAVNETVYDLCQKLTLPDGSRLIEGEGGGIRAARERMAAAGLKPLRFHDTGVAFVAVISRRRLLSDADLAWLGSAAAGHRLSQEQRVILASMHHGQDWNNRLVRDEFEGVDSRDATALLQDLVSRGLAAATGARGGVRYRLADGLSLAPDDVPPVAEAGGPGSQPIDDKNDDGKNDTDFAGPNELLVCEVLKESSGALSVAELADRTGLSERQIRYVLAPMRRRGLVTMRKGKPQKWGLT